jgi:hypothetical protein
MTTFSAYQIPFYFSWSESVMYSLITYSRV